MAETEKPRCLKEWDMLVRTVRMVRTARARGVKGWDMLCMACKEVCWSGLKWGLGKV